MALVTVCCLFVCFAIVLVRLKTKSANTSKFKNVFKNVNLIIVLVAVVFSLFSLLSPSLCLPPGLVFPMFPLGLEVVAILAAFLTTNKEAREFLSRKLSRVKDQAETGTGLRGRRGVGSQVQGVGEPAIPLKHRNTVWPVTGTCEGEG